MKITSEFPPLIPRKEDGRIDFSVCFKEGIAKAHARAAELSTSTAAAKTYARQSRTTASAFVPHEPDSVSFVEDGWGVRYRRTCEAGCIRYEQMPPEHGRFGCDGRYRYDAPPAQDAGVKPEPLTFPQLLADTENIMLFSRGAPNATRLWQLLKGLSDENVHDLLVFGSDAVNLDAVNALFRVFTDGVQPNDTPAIAAAVAAKNVQPTPEPVVRILGEQVAESELAQALWLIRQKNAPAVKEAPRGLMCVREDFDHRLGYWNEV